MISTLGIPVVIAAIALSFLWERFDEFALYFFAELQFQERVALLALLFATMFAAVRVSQVATGKQDSGSKKGGASGSEETVEDAIDYPLEEMNQALSDRQKFSSLYTWLRDSILEQMRTDNELKPESIDWIRRMMDHTIPGGKLNRGTTVVAVYRTIQGRPLTAYEIARASTLGWTIELLQAFFLIADDVIDSHETRRGQPCWYKLPDVKTKAVNDSFLMESFVFTIAKKYFSTLPSYTAILELLLDVIQKTELGQLLDLNISSGRVKGGDISRFSLENYQLIVRYKTAYYSFYLPVALAMNLAGIQDQPTFEITKQICCIMGEYFQVQDDYIDCYGDAKHSGKTGTDIEDAKCTWLIVQALDKCTPSQRKILEENYGKDDKEKVKLVKQVYQELKLQEAFHEYQEESYEEIQSLLTRIKVIPKDVFKILLKKVYKRTLLPK
jgi:farnesyl diphosphate synthase